MSVPVVLDTEVHPPWWAKAVIVNDWKQPYKVCLRTDCTGADAPGDALSQVGELLPLGWDHRSGSEQDCRTRAFLKNQVTVLKDNMCQHSFSNDSPDECLLYVAGSPCQSFSPRNHVRKGWEDRRAELLGKALKQAANADVALVENSASLLSPANQFLGKIRGRSHVLVSFLTGCGHDSGHKPCLPDRSHMEPMLEELRLAGFLVYCSRFDPAAMGFCTKRARMCLDCCQCM